MESSIKNNMEEEGESIQNKYNKICDNFRKFVNENIYEEFLI